MKIVRVNGEPYCATQLDDCDVTPGLLVSGTTCHKAMRVVCIDGADAVLRNLRYPNLLEAEPLKTFTKFYARIEPLESQNVKPVGKTLPK